MEFVIWLQSVMQGPGWDAFWTGASKLWSEEAAMVLLPVIYWVGGRGAGRLFATVFLLSTWLNPVLKGFTGTQRPMGSNIRVLAVDTGGEYAMPSGHAQGSAAAYSTLGRLVRRRWFTLLAAVAIFLVGFSRLYLGVHLADQVLVGWAVGLALAWAVAALWAPVGAALGRLPLAAQVAVGVAGPAALTAVVLYTPAIARVGVSDTVSGLGALAGFWAGSLLEERSVRFDHRAAPVGYVLRVAVGLAIVLALRVGLKPLLPAGDWFQFLRYACMGLGAAWLAPWLFRFLPGQAPARQPGAAA